MKVFILSAILIVCPSLLFPQDTFSIVAVDSTTREVGSAGGSCVDLFSAGIADPGFLGDLLPDTGAINTQAFYLTGNQTNARIRMRMGDTPQEIVDWLSKQDVQGNSTQRQYGIAGFVGMQPAAAGFTGVNCTDYKNHITGCIEGIYYAIQGNILWGPEILESMEEYFRNATGDLACRLMAALQGAKTPGADTRCADNGTSTLFAFLKVAQPTDGYGQPSFSIGVRTHDGAGIEPVDTLQTIFDQLHECVTSGSAEINTETTWSMDPNPASQHLQLWVPADLIGRTYSIFDTAGQLSMKGRITMENMVIDLHQLSSGRFQFQIQGVGSKPFVIAR